MPKKVIIIFFLVVLLQTAFGQSIMDIQQTVEPGDDNTYPSTYDGQQVTISPVIIGVKGFNGSDNNMFALDLNPGIWNGIYLNNTTNTVNEKTLVSVTGTVNENNGMTELTDATITIINQGPIDVTANTVTISQLQDPAMAEQYESSLIKINNLVYSGTNDGAYWLATDSENNEIRVGSGFFDANPTSGDDFGSITGLLVYDGTNFALHPRNNADLIASTPATLAVSSDKEKIGNKLYVHINSSNIKDYWGLNGFEFTYTYDDEYLAYQSYELGMGIQSNDSPEVTESMEDGVYTLNYSSAENFASFENPTLITLIFDILEYGVATVNFSSFKFTDDAEAIWNITNLSALSVSYNNGYDTKKAYLSIRNTNNDKNIFNPYFNERLTIKYGFKPGFSTKTIVRIYDLKGRLVYTPVNKVHSGLGEYTWDGRDKNRELVDIGTYICQVEVVIRETGDKYVTDQPIVVAGQLK